MIRNRTMPSFVRYSMELKICHLYPDVLNLYGDRGNILCFEKRLAWRGIGCSVHEKRIGDSVRFSEYDLFFIGGGQDFEQALLLEDCRKKAADWKAAIEDGLPFLCICGGYQLLGNYYVTADGLTCEYLGAVDFYTVGSRSRMIGNFAFRLLPASGGGIVVGFENHGGRTHLGPGTEPLGRVLYGHGNGDDEKTEGVRYRNVFGTYCHGPVLPKNPAFCDHILEKSLERKYGTARLEPLDDISENKARAVMLTRLGLSSAQTIS